MNADFDAQRQKMVEQQIRQRNVRDPQTLAAMNAVPRHQFVPQELMTYAYDDNPLPIGHGQTISQPYIVALMTAAAELDNQANVLEVGTGSGYAAAILSQIAKTVYTIECVEPLATQAKHRLQALGYTNVTVTCGDGTLGWPEHAPYDAIIVTAGAPVVPESFYDQLKLGGRIVIPVGDALSQKLLRLRKLPDGEFSREVLEYVRFVPLLGKYGW